MQKKIVYFKVCNSIEEYKNLQSSKSKKINIITKLIDKINNRKEFNYNDISKHIVKGYVLIKHKARNIVNVLIKYKFQVMAKYIMMRKIETKEYDIYVICNTEVIPKKGHNNIINIADINNCKVENGKKYNKIIKKINNRIARIIKNNPNTKIILSKQIKQIEKNIKNKTKISYVHNIIEYYDKNKYLYNNYIREILDSVMKLKNEMPEAQSIYVLIKENRLQYVNKIMEMLPRYKTINIVTPNINDFIKLENNLEEVEDMLTILNNKRKSLSRAKYIINVDFTLEEIMQYNICRTAIIFNISDYSLSNIKNFDGIIINNVRIKTCNKEEFDIQDEYVCGIYNKNDEIAESIEKCCYNLIGNNENINLKELQK